MMASRWSAALAVACLALLCAMAPVRAEDTLADRNRFGLDAVRWKAFLEALDAPPRDLPRLSRLFQEPSVFDDGTTQ